jgi:exonuclease VII large subunit
MPKRSKQNISTTKFWKRLDNITNRCYQSDMKKSDYTLEHLHKDYGINTLEKGYKFVRNLKDCVRNLRSLCATWCAT